LRCIEYYRGILFLTTNRVGTFDDAFMSRIHIVIAYKQLDQDDRIQIWKQFFDKLRADKPDFHVLSRARKYVLTDQEMVELQWNGRQIRNGKHPILQLLLDSLYLAWLLTVSFFHISAFQTAVALAEYRFLQRKKNLKPGDDDADLGPELDQEDFESVREMTSQFQEYLNKVHGLDEHARAFYNKTRAYEEGIEGPSGPHESYSAGGTGAHGHGHSARAAYRAARVPR
jgi:hypothetical protein